MVGDKHACHSEISPDAETALEVIGGGSVQAYWEPEEPADRALASLNNVIGWTYMTTGIKVREIQPRVSLTHLWDAPREFWHSTAVTGWLAEAYAQAVNILKTDYEDDVAEAPADDDLVEDDDIAEAPADDDLIEDDVAEAPADEPDELETGAIDPGTLDTVDAATLSADELIGTTVYGADDENVGSIGDVILSEDGEVDAIIVDVGGFLGIASKEVAVGMDDLEFMTDADGNMYLYTQFTQEQLEAQPEYDASTYAEQRDEQRLTIQ